MLNVASRFGAWGKHHASKLKQVNSKKHFDLMVALYGVQETRMTDYKQISLATNCIFTNKYVND